MRAYSLNFNITSLVARQTSERVQYLVLEIFTFIRLHSLVSLPPISLTMMSKSTIRHNEFSSPPAVWSFSGKKLFSYCRSFSSWMLEIVQLPLLQQPFHFHCARLSDSQSCFRAVVSPLYIVWLLQCTYKISTSTIISKTLQPSQCGLPFFVATTAHFMTIWQNQMTGWRWCAIGEAKQITFKLLMMLRECWMWLNSRAAATLDIVEKTSYFPSWPATSLKQFLYAGFLHSIHARWRRRPSDIEN